MCVIRGVKGVSMGEQESSCIETYARWDLLTRSRNSNRGGRGGFTKASAL